MLCPMVGEEQGSVVPSRSVERRRRPLWPWLLGGGAAIVVAAAIVIPVSLNAAAETARQEAEQKAAAEAAAAEQVRLDQFQTQLRRCAIPSMKAGSTVTVLDDGEALEMLRVTKFDGPSYADLECMLNGLGAPASLESEIGQTRALDGRQQDEWDGFSISWSYHPDDGASVLIKHAD